MYIHVCIYVYLHVCLYTYTCIYIYIYIYIYVYIQYIFYIYILNDFANQLKPFAEKDFTISDTLSFPNIL